MNVDRCQHVPTSPGQTMCTCLDERMWLRLCLELAARRIVQLETEVQRGTGAIIDVTATRKDTPAMTDSPAATSIDADPEFFHGLTIWCGDSSDIRVSAQIRDAGQLAVYVGPAAERSTEDNHPVILPADDARRLRDLLNVATARGML